MVKNQKFVKIYIVEHQIEVDFISLVLLCQEQIVEKENGVMVVNVWLKMLILSQQRLEKAQLKQQQL